MKATSRSQPLPLSNFYIPLFTVVALCLTSVNSLRAQTLAEAVDAPLLTWTTGGNQSWVGQTTATHDGVDAAQSGLINDSQESWFQTTVTGPGLLTFWWKVSSEEDYDFLEFYLNGVRQTDPISGEVGWQQRTFNLGGGSQTLRWRYMKDDSFSSGQDRGWVDRVSFVPPSGPVTIITQPQSRTVVEGSSVTLSVVAGGEPPLSYQWLKSATALTNATSSSFSILIVQTNDAASYSVIVSNTFGSVTSAPALLTVNATMLDVPFNPGADLNVNVMAVQSDGRILVAGDFAELGGRPCNNIGRLNPDGTVDTTFNSEAGGTIYSLAIQTDGKILVGGDFSFLGGEPRSAIGRLNADGTIDSTFDPGVTGGSSSVNSLVVQADGKIVVGGDFTTLAGQPRNNIGRLNVAGTLDNTFINLDVDGEVFSLALQPNGTILVGGGFTILVPDSDGDLIEYFNLVRLNTSGTLDENFYPDPDSWVSCLAVQPNGMVLVSGGFLNMAGQPRESIARITGNGDVDATFSPATDGEILSIALQTDGKILLGGAFSTLSGQPRNNIGRLNANGTLDNTFATGVDGFAGSLSVQSDGKILVGGNFSAVDGQQRSPV